MNFTQMCVYAPKTIQSLRLHDDVFITIRDAIIKLIYDEKTRDKVAGLLLSDLSLFLVYTLRLQHLLS